MLAVHRVAGVLKGLSVISERDFYLIYSHTLPEAAQFQLFRVGMETFAWFDSQIKNTRQTKHSVGERDDDSNIFL